ncbi:MAG: KpsF/GutQ family sugar-phosphate isomerase, partial [Fuerstiella sp.]|nr:KpsF/GutQ family sugar-phosphate isomerase [Fuerstiella sp.]
MRSTADDEPNVFPFKNVDQLREAKSVIRREADALQSLADRLDESFCDAVRLIQQSAGVVIVTGVGKAGLIGRKIVATMASTGIRSAFLHPTEAVHGDLGCVASNDVVLALSNSGSSEEILRLLPIFAKLNVPIVAITRDANNPLARESQVVLQIGHHAEAGNLQLAPTVSTTAMLAMGDALALTLSRAKGFTEGDFAVFHPAGTLGQKIKPVRELMRSGDQLRIAADTATVRQVMSDLSRPGRRTGAVILTGPKGAISGIFTDSDLARLFEHRREYLVDEPISNVMTVNPTTTRPNVLLLEATRLMSELKLSELPVTDDSGRPL